MLKVLQKLKLEKVIKTAMISIILASFMMLSGCRENPISDKYITISAIDDMNSVTFRGGSVDGQWYDPKYIVVDSGSWSYYEDFSTYTSIDNQPLVLQLAEGDNQRLVFNVGPDEGSVRIQKGKVFAVLDLYADTVVENGRGYSLQEYLVAEDSECKSVISYEFFLLAFFILLFITLYILYIRKKPLLKRCGSREAHEQLFEIIVPIAFTFLLVIFAPLDLFCTNRSEFWFDIYDLIPVLLVGFIIIGLLFIGFGYVLGRVAKPLGRLYFLILCSALLVLYMQGNFFSFNLPEIVGNDIQWNLYSKDVIYSWLLLFAFIAIPILHIYRYGFNSYIKYENFIIAAICGIIVLTLVTELLTCDGVFKKKTSFVVTDDHLMEYSSDENFIILLVDCVDAGVVNGLINNDDGFKNTFEDFSFYRNTMSLYPSTITSIPQILTGEKYLHQEEYSEYYLKGLQQSPLLNNLKNKGFLMSLYEPSLREDSMAGVNNFKYSDESFFVKEYENVMDSSPRIGDYWKYIMEWSRLVGYKYLPYQAKPIVNAESINFDQIMQGTIDNQIYSWSNLEYWNSIQDSEITLRIDRTFKFIHLEGGHPPFHIDQNVKEIGEGSEEQQVIAVLNIINAYLNKLKTARIYDNSIIVIMADHGNRIANMGQNPIFFVKGKFEKHALITSDSPVSYEDLQGIYKNLMNGAQGEEALVYKGDLNRSRTFYENKFIRKNEPIVEYEHIGYANDNDGFYKTGDIYEWKVDY